MIFHSKYRNLFKILDFPNIRYAVIVGGRASGKSTAVSNFVHDLSFTGAHVILNTRFTFGSAKDSVIAEFDKTLSDRNSIDLFKSANYETENVLTSAKVIFKGLKAGSNEQTARLKSITNLNVWVLDEAEELHSESVFDDVDDSIRRDGFPNLVIFVLNSHHITKDHFIYRRFFEDSGVSWGFNGMKGNALYIHTSYIDNIKNLSQSYIDKIEHTRRTYPDKYRYNFLGELRDKAEGVVFPNWTYGDFDESLPFGYGMDFGFFPDPDVVIRVAIDNKRKKIYCKSEIQLNSAGLDVLTAEMKTTVQVNRAIYADSSEPRLISDLKRRGINGIVGVKKYAGSVLAGIKLMQGYDIIVHTESIDIGRELNNYVWIDKRGGVPIDAYNHRLDAIRYYVQSVISNKPISTQRVL